MPSYQAGLGPQLLGPDVTGDQLTDPFEYRPGSGADVQWRATASGAFAKAGAPVAGAYRPATGDFDGNGFDDILWHGTGSTADSIWWFGPGGRTTQALQVNGSYVPIVNDFDGDGTDDIFWYATGLARDSVWYFTTAPPAPLAGPSTRTSSRRSPSPATSTGTAAATCSSTAPVPPRRTACGSAPGSRGT